MTNKATSSPANGASDKASNKATDEISSKIFGLKTMANTDILSLLSKFEQTTGLNLDYSKPSVVQAFKIMYWFFTTFGRYVGRLKMFLFVFGEIIKVFLGYLRPLAWALVVSALTKILVVIKTPEGRQIVEMLASGNLMGFFNTQQGALLLTGLGLYALSLIANYILGGRLFSMWRSAVSLKLIQAWRYHTTAMFNKLPFDILVFPKIQNVVQEIDSVSNSRLQNLISTTFTILSSLIKGAVALVATYVVLGPGVVAFLIVIMGLYALTYTKIMQFWVKYNLAIRPLTRVSQELWRWRRTFTNYLTSRYMFWADYINKLHYKMESVFPKGMLAVVKQEAFYTITRVILKTLAFLGLATSLALKTIKQGLDIGRFLFFYDVIKRAVISLEALSGMLTVYFSDFLPAVAYGYKLEKFVNFVTQQVFGQEDKGEGLASQDSDIWGGGGDTVVSKVLHLEDGASAPEQTRTNIIELSNIEFEYPFEGSARSAAKQAVKQTSKTGRTGFKLVIDHLAIKPGMNIAIVGPNGAGKTTLLQIIKGLYKPQKGSVQVAGTDPYLLSEHTRLRLFAQVPQDFPKLPFLRVKDVVMLDYMALVGLLPYALDKEKQLSRIFQEVLSIPYEFYMNKTRVSKQGSKNSSTSRGKGVQNGRKVRKVQGSNASQNFDIFDRIMEISGHVDAKTRKQIEHALEVVDLLKKVRSLPLGLNTPLSPVIKNGVDLSSGQWQRLHLARTVFYKRPIVVLDEPTSAIDPVAGYKIIESIFREFREQTVLLVSHKYSLVHDADLIIVVKDGTIAEIGTHAQLMRKGGYYAQAYKLEVSKLRH